MGFKPSFLTLYRRIPYSQNNQGFIQNNGCFPSFQESVVKISSGLLGVAILACLVGPVVLGHAEVFGDTLAGRVPGKPLLIAPAPGAVIPFTNRVVFSWFPAKRALRYTVFVGQDGKPFTNVLVRGAAKTNLVVDAQFRAGTYTWMAMAWNTNGAGPWSTTVTFRVQERMMSPGGGERLAETNPPVFRWENTPGASFYQAKIEVYQASDDARSTTNGRYQLFYQGGAMRDGSGNWAPTGRVFSPASYRWQVREKIRGAWAPWSKPASFRIAVPSPAKPVEPHAGAVTGKRPTFEWVAGPNPLNVLFQIRVWKNGAVRGIFTGMPASPFTIPVGYDLLDTGNMTWQIRAYEQRFLGDIPRFGPWSPLVPFTVKVN